MKNNITVLDFLQDNGLIEPGKTSFTIKFNNGKPDIDLIKLITTYAQIKCAEQRTIIGDELVTYTEDISIPNQRKIHDLCVTADAPEF